jgi:predicted phosphodiesterase
MRASILHIADLHMNKRDIDNINKVIYELIEDLKRMYHDYNIKPDKVFFTGDMIKTGDNSKEEYELAIDKFIVPLLKHLGLDESDIFIIPGNHDIDRSEIDEIYEKGLDYELLDNNNTYKYVKNCIDNNNMKDCLNNKLSSYFNLNNLLNNKNKIYANYFYDVYKFELNKINFGIIGINSTWRSVDYRSDDGKLLISDFIIQKASELLIDCDFKIAIAHHPLDMLQTWNKENIKMSLAQNVNMLCTGHIHNSNFEYSRQLLGSLYMSTCASLYSGRIKNGYTLLDLDFEKEILSVYLRKWYGKTRKEFDQETEKCHKGLITYNNFKTNSDDKNNLIEICKIRGILLNSIDLPNMIMPISIKQSLSIEQVYVEPLIRDSSSYNKSTNINFIKLNDIIVSTDNIFFYAGAEYGKSSLLNHIQYEILKSEKHEDKIPIVINSKELSLKYHKSLINTIVNTLQNKYTKDKIENYLNNGNIILLIDDYDDIRDDNRHHRNKIVQEIMSKYSKCRFVFAVNEKLTQSIMNDYNQIIDKLDAVKYYIAPFNTTKIREILNKWQEYENFDVERMLKQIVYYFKQLRIPVTPMAINMFLGVLFRDKDHKNIKNEAYLIEKYLERILEKLQEDEISESDLDFKDKESFLASLAVKMVNLEKSELSEYEFIQFKIDYFKDIGERVPTDKTFNEMFNTQILKLNNRVVIFGIKQWYYFFIAKAMQRDPSFKNAMLERSDYLKFSKSFSYKAGLDRNDISLLEIVDNRIKNQLNDTVTKYINNGFSSSATNDVFIAFNDDIKKEIRDKNTIEAKDRYRDKKYLSYDAEPVHEGDDGECNLDTLDDISQLLMLHTDITRNTRDINATYKKQYIKNNVTYHIALMWDILEELKCYIEKINFKEIKLLLDSAAVDKPDHVDVDLLYKRLQELVFNIIPLSIVQHMSDRLGNPKLVISVIELIKEEKLFVHKVFYSLLLFKINFDDSIVFIKEIIKSSKSTVIDFVIFYSIRILCFENKLKGSDLDIAISLMESIRSKYSVKHAQIPLYIKDTFASDIRKSILKAKLANK